MTVCTYWSTHGSCFLLWPDPCRASPEQTSSVFRLSTLDHYGNDLEYHVKPRLGQRGLHTTLHHALKSAVDQRLLPRNSADHVEPPKIAHKTMNILNDEQIDTFLSVVEQDPIRNDFFYTELTTGLRSARSAALCGLTLMNEKEL